MAGFRHFRFRHIGEQRLKRLVGSLLLVTMLALIIGIPLPTQTRKTSSMPFPCQERSCGCDSAARCWNQCCCHTDEQKLTWAEKNGVSPPHFLVQRVRNARESAIFADGASPQNAVRQCCANKTTTAAQSPSESTKEGDLEDVSPEDKSVARVLLIGELNKCKGIEMALKLLSSSLVTFNRHGLTQTTPCHLYTLPLFDEHSESAVVCIDPPIP